MNNPIKLDYTNWKGVRSSRNIIPIELVYTSTDYHPEVQWFLVAFDKDKDDVRSFAIKDIHFPVHIDQKTKTDYGDLDLILPKISEIKMKDIISIYYSKNNQKAILPPSYFTEKQDPEATFSGELSSEPKIEEFI